MSITDELREFMDGADGYELWCPRHKEELTAIADRIDAEHESACGEAYGNGVQSVALPDLTAYVKLPVDADGEVIHIGDVMDKGKVTCICDCGKGWEVILNNLYTYDASSLHHHEPTVEDVLREFVRDFEAWRDYDGPINETPSNPIAEYAKRLTLAEMEDA